MATIDTLIKQLIINALYSDQFASISQPDEHQLYLVPEQQDLSKTATSFSLTIDPNTFVITAKLLDQDGNIMGTEQTIDLPLESAVVGGRYDAANKRIVLTLQDGETVNIPVGDLISGLQTEITSENKLPVSLVDGIGDGVLTITVNGATTNFDTHSNKTIIIDSTTTTIRDWAEQ